MLILCRLQTPNRSTKIYLWNQSLLREEGSGGHVEEGEKGGRPLPAASSPARPPPKACRAFTSSSVWRLGSWGTSWPQPSHSSSQPPVFSARELCVPFLFLCHPWLEVPASQSQKNIKPAPGAPHAPSSHLSASGPSVRHGMLRLGPCSLWVPPVCWDLSLSLSLLQPKVPQEAPAR